MATWTHAEISLMAASVGWGANADSAAWVAMAESGGDDHIVNSIGCVGLLQINQPAHASEHPQWSTRWLQDPMNNLSAGLVLFKAAGQRFDRDWADSQHKGGIPEGWGPHVPASLGGGGSGSSVQQAGQATTEEEAKKACAYLKGTPGYDMCIRDYKDSHADPYAPGGDGGSVLDTAGQIARLAQAVAKAGNWVADPANWVRVAYITGGAVLALVAVNTIIQPYAARSYRQVAAAIPTRTIRDVSRQVRRNPKKEDSGE